MANNSLRTVGILGGGQLSKMLCDAALKLKLSPVPFCFAADEPAALICRNFMQGGLSDAVSLESFFSKVDVIAYESDFLPFESLKKFSRAKFVPELSSLERVRDKLLQKEIFASLGIPTSKFKKFDTGDLKGWIKSSIDDFKGKCVFKWARGGYDGKGVFIYNGKLEKARTFCEEALKKGIGVFAEEKISYVRELALISAYSVSERFSFYPLVISEQENGICKRVRGPAKALGVSSGLEFKAQDYAQKIGTTLKLHGVFAVEFFETDSGELLLNELAPRVHNSGHFSMDASASSQFENHWRSILGLELGDLKSAPAFAMLNLLGPRGEAKEDISKLSVPEDFFFHWYGKKESREGRKMGHINLVCQSVGELEEKLPILDQLEKKWLSKFSKSD